MLELLEVLTGQYDLSIENRASDASIETNSGTTAAPSSAGAAGGPPDPDKDNAEPINLHNPHADIHVTAQLIQCVPQLAEHTNLIIRDDADFPITP